MNHEAGCWDFFFLLLFDQQMMIFYVAIYWSQNDSDMF